MICKIKKKFNDPSNLCFFEKNTNFIISGYNIHRNMLNFHEHFVKIKKEKPNRGKS